MCALFLSWVCIFR